MGKPCTGGNKNLTMKIIQTKITPSQASELLGNNPDNRLVSPTTVKEYVQDMKERKWMSNGETIKIYNDTNNRKLPITKHRLIDGQHRLTACVKSNVPLDAVIAVVDSPDVFKTIDTGKKRSTKDCLDILGYSNTSCLAAALALIKKVDTSGLTGGAKTPGGATTCKVRNHEIEEIARQYPTMTESVAYANRARTLLKTRPATMSVIHYKLSEIDHDLAEEFLNSFHGGEGLKRTSAVLHARNRIIKRLMSDKMLTPFYLMKILFTAWNHWISGNEVTKLQITNNETLPKLRHS
jgi:hypothetical protein